jgi:alkylhydroperoxidase family enzyme
VLIGVVPNCDRYLEIWAPGFRTYNLMVPAFLQLPASLVGLGAPKAVVGLAMYTSSRAAACAYCSAHTCSFALRRGSSPGSVVGSARTPAEHAAVAVAEALSTLPHRLTSAHREALRRCFSAAHAEWVVMGVAMMGFLNKFMDALGVELEPASVADVSALIGPTGWSIGQHDWAHEKPLTGASLPPQDSLSTLLRVARHAPGAIRLERAWMRGIPRSADAVRGFVAEHFGYDEPLLTTITLHKPRRALAAMLRLNLDPALSKIGIGPKALAGLVFATRAGNPQLARRAQSLAVHAGVPADTIRAVAAFDPHASPDPDTRLEPRLLTIVRMAHAISPSPAAVDDATVAAARAALQPAEVVELTVWVSLCQLMHRLTVWFDMVDEPVQRAA